MKTFEQLQKEHGESTCGRSTELYIYQYFQAQMHEYGKTLQGTILDLEWDLNHHKEKAAREVEILESKVDELTESYQLEQEENIRLVERKDTLEEWLTEYRDQLKKENVYHKNQGIINAINELLNETSTDI